MDVKSRKRREKVIKSVGLRPLFIILYTFLLPHDRHWKICWILDWPVSTHQSYELLWTWETNSTGSEAQNLKIKALRPIRLSHKNQKKIIIQSLPFRKLILTALPHFITMTLIQVRRADRSLLKLSLRLE